MAPQAAQQVGWLKHVKSVGVTLATAAFLAVPRGPARASELPPPTTLSLQAKGSTPNSRPTLAFLGFRKKRKHTLVPPQVLGPPRADEIDMDALVSKKAAKRYTERSYIFSDAITAKSDLVDELEQLDEDANDRRVQKSASTLVMWGGAGGMVYLAVQGLQGIERYMKRQEEEDIEAERELTGQYVSVDAGDVESVIDPKTGKNITIAKRDPPKKKDANATDVDAAPKQAPWLLRKLGLDGVASSDDDDFWWPPTPRSRASGPAAAAAARAARAERRPTAARAREATAAARMAPMGSMTTRPTLTTLTICSADSSVRQRGRASPVGRQCAAAPRYARTAAALRRLRLPRDAACVGVRRRAAGASRAHMAARSAGSC